ncbi:MAG: helix-turn-helix transcriptional regulator [Steroidobacteraceae bacterium]
MSTRLWAAVARRAGSQAELAGHVHVSRNSINAIENGRFDPSARDRAWRRMLARRVFEKRRHAR